MNCRYFRGEPSNPFTCAGKEWDVRGEYWRLESFMWEWLDGTRHIDGFPCACWPDYIARAKASLEERSCAFCINFEISKHGGGEHNEDWYSYFPGPRVRWERKPFKIPKKGIDQTKYRYVEVAHGRSCYREMQILFGPIVTATYRGVNQYSVPVFELKNLMGDKLYTIAEGPTFRLGEFKVAGKYKCPDGDEMKVFYYDKRLHVALAKLIVDDEAPAVCVGQVLQLPTQDEVEREMRWYRLPKSVLDLDKRGQDMD